MMHTLELKILPGTDLSDALQELIRVHKLVKSHVEMEFNGKKYVMGRMGSLSIEEVNE